MLISWQNYQNISALSIFSVTIIVLIVERSLQHYRTCFQSSFLWSGFLRNSVFSSKILKFLNLNKIIKTLFHFKIVFVLGTHLCKSLKNNLFFCWLSHLPTGSLQRESRKNGVFFIEINFVKFCKQSFFLLKNNKNT